MSDPAAAPGEARFLHDLAQALGAASLAAETLELALSRRVEGSVHLALLEGVIGQLDRAREMLRARAGEVAAAAQPGPG